MKKTFFVQLVVLMTLLLSSVDVQAQEIQEMTEKKVKKANVIVLLDEGWDSWDSTKKGNTIYIRLNDKSRPAHKRNEILIHENHKTLTMELDDDALGVDDDEITIIKLNHPNSLCIANDISELKLYIGLIGNTRKYVIDTVGFYETFDDVINVKPLGFTDDMDVAYEYIAKIFKAFCK